MRVGPLAYWLAALLTPVSAVAGVDEGMAAFQRRDWVAAAREFRPLAAEGNAAAQARLGHILMQGLLGTRDDVEGLKLLNAAAHSGDAMAQNALGNAYLAGRGVPKQPATALVWFGRAADQDYPDSLHALGEMYFNGVGVAKDETRGVEYYSRAAEKDVLASIDKMAELSWNGRAMPTDRIRAVQYARRAAEARRPLGQFIMGVALLTGEGIEKNPAEAVRWFRRAAEQGHAQAQHNLGVTLVTGNGVAKSLTDGYFWLALAAERAPAQYKATYERERNAIGAKISPAELTQINGRVATWTPPAADGSRGMAATMPPPPSTPSATSVPPPVATAPSGPATQTMPPVAPTQRSATSTGTGIVVGRDGTVLTNAHVVEQCRTIAVKPVDGPAVVAAVIAKDSGEDLALLKTQLRPAAPARFRQDRAMRSGDDVVVVGYPLSSLLSREPNVTAGVISAMAGIHGDNRLYQITAPVQKGNSGGPLSDSSGNVVGVVSSKLNAMKIAGQTGDLPQNINFAIKSEVARKFMDRYSVSYETAPAGQPMSAADVGDRIKPVTVFIQCRVN